MKIFAHRGFSHKFPEASSAAYLGAVAAGSGGFECDVRLSKDGHIICFHDHTTRRIGKKARFVSRLSLEELRGLADVITLDELLDIAISTKQDLLIETKHPVLSGGRIEREVCALLKTKENESRNSGINITIMSFSYLAVQRLKKQYPRVAKVIKYSFSALINREELVAVNIEILRKHPGLLRKMHAKEIYAWTVNSREDLRWLAKQEINGVITDRVTRAKNCLTL